MDDNRILELYLKRSETAIGETAYKYGSYCFAIAINILKIREDAEECVNDTYMKAWNAIPPERPVVLSAFLGKITRNISLNKYKANNTKKRNANMNLLFNELEQCLPSANNVEDEFDMREAEEHINYFLRSIEKENRVIFVRRYWHGESIKTIAEKLKMNKNTVASSLFRTRSKLKAYLEKEGVTI